MTLKKSDLPLITPNWPAPSCIKAFSTTVEGGVSKGVYTPLNLADHVDDELEKVAQNRQLLANKLDIDLSNVWLTQTHSKNWVKMPSTKKHIADASYTQQKKAVCCVMTADCVPVLFCNKQGDFVAAVHAGWQGVFNGIIKKIQTVYPNTNELMAWIGPCIHQDSFEVGEDFYQKFIMQNSAYKKAFIKKEKWHFDMVEATKMQLKAVGVNHIYGAEDCTFSNERFFSYRQNNKTGRIASLIWVDN